MPTVSTAIASTRWLASPPGLGLRTYPSGRRAWIVRFRVHGRQRLVTIGDPAVYSTRQAQQAAAAIIRDALTIPAAKPPAAVTFGALAHHYLEHARAHHRRPEPAERYLCEVAGPLHALKASEITRANIAELLASVSRERGPVAANRARAKLSACYAMGIADGLVENNPVQGTRKLPERTRDRVLGNGELAMIWQATGSGDAFDRIVRLLLLTGCRRSEVAGLNRQEIDGSTWTLPAHRSKNGRAHVVHLSELAMASLPDVDTFGARPGRPFSGLSRAKARLDATLASQIVEPWCLHDLRRSFATGLGELGVAPHVIEACLNHAPQGVAAIYNRASLTAAKRVAWTRWGEHVEALASRVSGEPGEEAILVSCGC